MTWKATLDEPQVISAVFKGTTMFVSTLRGLSVYDVAQPEAPVRIGLLGLPHFENEDVDMSMGKDFLLISNDPSAGKGILYVIDVSGPAAPAILGQMDTGTADLGLATPKNLPVEEASGGLATHDVQFDRAGHALITGGGGTAIYDVTNPLAPVLLSQTDEEGESDYVEDFGQDGSSLNDFIHHNSHRLPNSSLFPAPAGPANADSDVVVIVEEDYTRPTCEGAGSLQTWRINGTEMNNLDFWEVEVDPARTSLCSAHYFDEDAGLLAQGWYEQGTRFLDVTDPTDIRQVGFWIPQKNVTWGAVYHPLDGETVY